MIPDGVEIIPGMTARHDEGLLYRVDDVRRSTNGYEVSHELGGLTVNYTQLEQGSFPPGTQWSKDEEGFRTHFTVEEALSIFEDLEEKKELVQPGEYKVVDGDDEPLQVDSGKVHIFDDDGPKDYKPGLPGVYLRGWYGIDGEEPKEIVSFLYHKLDNDGNLETEERAIILTGIGYGEHTGHTGQTPTWYLVGPQIGTFEHESGQSIDFVDDSTVSAKNFSVACITDGPFGEPILANPA